MATHLRHALRTGSRLLTARPPLPCPAGAARTFADDASSKRRSALTLPKLAKELASKEGAPLGVDKTRALLEEAIDAITDSLRKGDLVSIKGLGKFEVKPTKARKRYNVQTKEIYQDDAGVKVSFGASDELKERVVPAA